MFIRLLIALLIVSLPSCKKNTENSLTIVDVAKIDASIQLKDSIIGDLIFSPLFLYEENRNVLHNTLAEKFTPLLGGKAIEIKIRKGVRFHDGREVTESDVAASISSMMEEDKYLKERYGQFKVAIIDKLKIRITGDKPLYNIEPLLSNLYLYSKNFTGTGPYRFSKWIDNGVELTANNDYFEGAPKLKKVIYRYEPDERKRINMLLEGKADLLVWLSPEMAGFLKEDNKFYVKECPAGFYSAIFLNNESSLFSDKRLRKAVSMAIDRDKLIKKVLKGGGVKTLTPLPLQRLHTENNTGYSPREAVRLLKDAGWRDADGDGILEKNGKKLRFRFYYSREIEEFKKMADLIGQNLFEIGIEVEAIPADIGENSDREFEEGSYDAAMGVKSSFDSVNMVVWSSSSIKNMSYFNNREMDSLLNSLRDTKDIKQKKEIYGRMQRIFEEEVPAVFLYNPLIFTAVSKRFKGAEEFIGNAYSMYKIKDWSVVNEDKDRSINEVFE